MLEFGLPRGRLAPAVGALRARRAAGAGARRLAGLARRRPLPRPEHPRLLRGLAAEPRLLGPGARRASTTSQPGGSASAAGSSSGGGARDGGAPRPSFYALRPGGWRDYVTLLHPPYTLWHLSYVAVGAALAPHIELGAARVDDARLRARHGRRRARPRRAARPAAAHADPGARSSSRSRRSRIAGAAAIGIAVAASRARSGCSPSSPSARSSSSRTTSSSSAGAFHADSGSRRPGGPSRC